MKDNIKITKIYIISTQRDLFTNEQTTVKIYRNKKKKK